MSLKGVELQIAIPKSVDAGRMAEQHQQNVVQQQYNANEALKKETERKQLTVNDTEEIAEILDEEEHKNRDGKGSNSDGKKKRKKQPDKVEAKHPFKGSFIDFSG